MTRLQINMEPCWHRADLSGWIKACRKSRSRLDALHDDADSYHAELGRLVVLYHCEP